MDGSMYEASPGLDSKRVRCPDEAGYLERALAITEWFGHTREPLSPRAILRLFARPKDQIHFFRAQAHWKTGVFAEHRIRGLKRCGSMHDRNRIEFFSVREQLRSALYLYAADGSRRHNGGSRELCVPTRVVFVYSFHHLLRNFRLGSRFRKIFCTIAGSEMMVLTLMAVLGAV